MLNCLFCDAILSLEKHHFPFCPEMVVESRWLQPSWLEERDLPAATAHLSPAEIHSRAGSLPAKWHRKEKETINTHNQHLFTDVHWQERSKETRLSSRAQEERVLMIPDLCFCSQHAQLSPCSSSAPASPHSPSHSFVPACSSFIATHALAAASSVLTPCALIHAGNTKAWARSQAW